MLRLAAVALLFLILAVIPGCSKGCGKSDAATSRTRVVVSIFPVYDLVRRVAGNDADVTLLFEPTSRRDGTFEPTPRETELASQAKLGVMVGLGFDSWMKKLMADAAPSARVLQVGDRVPTIAFTAESIAATREPQTGRDDPHVWLDPQRAQLIVRAIAEELGRIDASHAAAYRERATALDAVLAALDAEAEARIEALSRKTFVTFNGSFGYFAERYGLVIPAAIEPHSGVEPLGEYVSKVLSALGEKNVSALFSESQLDPGPVQRVAEEAKLPLGVLDPMGGGEQTNRYETMIRFNVAELEKYLR